ncbi:MAG: DUF2157 domain-containing protein [Planctomycetota bacterium]|nr:DUF2157 domain-containing protein [Planctomycetota bacterium]
MNITRSHLETAAQRGIIAPDQVEALWVFLSQNTADQPSFRFSHILYYFGGMIAIGAMTLFMTLGWEQFGGWGLFAIALAYAGGGIWLTEFFLNRRRLPIPAGITAAFVVALTPLAIYGLQVALGWWHEGREYREYHTHIDYRWIFMELSTLFVGAIMLRRYRLPFLVMPLAVTLWYMSMDLTPFLFGTDSDWQTRCFVSLIFGLLMILLAFWVDFRTRSEKDYAFWLYLFGVLAFWGGMSLMRFGDETKMFFYLCINLLMIIVGAILSRRVFVVFGGLGTAGYIGHLAYQIFKDSMLFTFALTAIGIGIIYLGLLWQRHEQNFSSRLRSYLPAHLREFLARRH